MRCQKVQFIEDAKTLDGKRLDNTAYVKALGRLMAWIIANPQHTIEDITLKIWYDEDEHEAICLALYYS